MDYYNYCINPESDEPIFLLDAQIGMEEDEPYERYIDGEIFARELMAIDMQGKKRIEIRINSEGGNVKQGMSIYAAILNTKTKVDTFVVGIAYSMAGVIFQAGRNRKMMDYATLMYHMAYDESGEQNECLDAINEAIATMISSRSWKDQEKVMQMMKKESFINAKDALDSDLCDEVITSDALNRPKMTQDVKASWKYAQEYANKFLPVNQSNNNKTKKTMNKVAQILNLNTDASEESIVAELTKILSGNDEAKKLEEEVERMKNQLKKAEDELETIKSKELQEEEARKEATAKAELEAQNKADAERKEKAKAKILNLVKEKGINDATIIQNYIDMAQINDESMEKVEKVINATPVVTKAANAFNGNKLEKNEQFSLITNEQGAVLDTESYVADMNARVRTSAMNRFKNEIK